MVDPAEHLRALNKHDFIVLVIYSVQKWTNSTRSLDRFCYQLVFMDVVQEYTKFFNVLIGRPSGLFILLTRGNT